MNDWIDALTQANKQEGFVDRQQRVCKELQNHTLVFTNDYTKPLELVKNLGWMYPSNKELASIVLGEEHHHLYSYTQSIQQQLPTIAQQLTNNPHTRRALIQLTDTTTRNKDYVPCMIAMYTAIRNDKLHLTVYMRSTDLLIGLPANLYQSFVVAQEIQKRVHKQLGSITFFINSAHVFEDYQQELAYVLESQTNT